MLIQIRSSALLMAVTAIVGSCILSKCICNADDTHVHINNYPDGRHKSSNVGGVINATVSQNLTEDLHLLQNDLHILQRR